MKTLHFASAFILLSIAINSNAQWNLTNYPSDKILRFPQYTSATKMWGIESGDNGIDPHVVLTSVDGCETFTRSTTTFKWIYNFYALSDNIAYLTADPLGTLRRQVYKTIDGGLTWDSIMPAIGQLICFDSLKLCIITSKIINGCFDYYTSLDGGANWNMQTGCSPNFNGLNRTLPFFLIRNQHTSTALLSIDSFLFKTNDYGNSWIVLNNNNFRNQVFRTVTFRDSLNGVAFRRYTDQQNQISFSTLHYTSDGGINWDTLTNIFPPIHEVRYLHNKNGNGQSLYIAGGDEGAIFSNDSAMNWRFFDNEKHSSLAFYNKETGLSYYPVSSGGRGLLKFVGPFTGIRGDKQKSELVSYSVYPNPANDILNVSYETLEHETELTIMDLTGKSFKSFLINNIQHKNKITLDISDLEKGLYFLRASDIGNIKFVKD
ncbi:MAG: T9SS type A sorting domain-containing protein [Bacteroidia bacterium]